jgi:hypothetical protein
VYGLDCEDGFALLVHVGWTGLSVRFLDWMFGIGILENVMYKVNLPQ